MITSVRIISWLSLKSKSRNINTHTKNSCILPCYQVLCVTPPVLRGLHGIHLQATLRWPRTDSSLPNPPRYLVVVRTQVGLRAVCRPTSREPHADLSLPKSNRSENSDKIIARVRLRNRNYAHYTLYRSCLNGGYLNCGYRMGGQECW